MGADRVALVRTSGLGTLMRAASRVFTQNGGHGVPLEEKFSLNQVECRSGDRKAGLKDQGRDPVFFLAFLHISNRKL